MREVRIACRRRTSAHWGQALFRRGCSRRRVDARVVRTTGSSVRWRKCARSYCAPTRSACAECLQWGASAKGRRFLGDIDVCEHRIGRARCLKHGAGFFWMAPPGHHARRLIPKCSRRGGRHRLEVSPDCRHAHLPSQLHFHLPSGRGADGRLLDRAARSLRLAIAS